MEDYQKLQDAKDNEDSDKILSLKEKMLEKEKQVLKLQMELQEKDRSLKEKTAIIKTLEDKLHNLEAKHAHEIE